MNLLQNTSEFRGVQLAVAAAVRIKYATKFGFAGLYVVHSSSTLAEH